MSAATKTYPCVCDRSFRTLFGFNWHLSLPFFYRRHPNY